MNRSTKATEKAHIHKVEEEDLFFSNQVAAFIHITVTLSHKGTNRAIKFEENLGNISQTV